MANALFFNLPFYGHMNPTVPLVAELTRRGDHITYYASETFRPAIEQAGAAFRGIDAFMTERMPVDDNLVRFAATLIRIASEMLPGLLAEAKANPPDYILFDSLCIWGRCVAEALRIPAVASVTTLARPHSPLHREVMVGVLPMLPWSASMAWAARRELRQFNAISKQLHETYGIRRLRLDEAYNNLAALNIVYSIQALQSWPNTFDEQFVFVGPLLDGRTEPADFPLEVQGDAPLVYVSLGTVFNDRVDFYRQCVRAFAETSYRIVLSIGDRIGLHSLGRIPDNIIVRPFVPQIEVLQHAALFITHGGMNSVNEGLLAGVPLLLAPQAADQFFIARRVQQLGAGRMLSPKDASAHHLRTAAEAILADPAFRQRSRAISDLLHQAGGVTAAAAAIDAFKRGHRLDVS